MKFSLLIAHYNNGKFFKDCYDSMLRQTYTNWEAIIVDDGSTDDSVQLIESLIRGDNRFSLYKNERNFGCGYTKKKCVEFATGSVCGFVDPDDALTADALYQNYLIHTQYTNVVLVHSDFFYCDEQLQQQQLSHKTGAVSSQDKLFFNLDYKVFHFATFCKEAYGQTAGIDAYMQRAVDQDLYLKMAERGIFYYINKPLYNYRIHGNSLSCGDKSKYWHWFAIMNAAKRRNINIENLFVANYISRKEYNGLAAVLHNSRVLKVWNGANKYLQKLFC